VGGKPFDFAQGKKMEIAFRFRIIIEIVGAVACAFVLKKYGYLPMGIVFSILAIIFLDVLTPDESDFKN
jgi:hypothetical protein